MCSLALRAYPYKRFIHSFLSEKLKKHSIYHQLDKRFSTRPFFNKSILSKPDRLYCAKKLTMALQNDWDDLMANVDWEDSEIDSGYFDSDNEAGNPGS